MNMWLCSRTMTGARSEDHRDLGDDTGGQHVAVEDAAVGVEGDDTLLDAGAGAVVEPDHRDADGGGQIHDLVDLLSEDLAEGAPEDREVLREDAHPAPVDGPEAGDHAIGVGPAVQAGGRRPVPGQHVELLKGPLVEQVVDPLTGGQLALGVLALHRRGRAGVAGLLLALAEVLEAILHGMFRHRGQATEPAAAAAHWGLVPSGKLRLS
jgi:hypothetical protein